MTISKMFSLFSEEKLREAFEEFQEHEKTKILKDGILRGMVELIEEQDPHSNTALTIMNIEMGLLKEMALRFYNK